MMLALSCNHVGIVIGCITKDLLSECIGGEVVVDAVKLLMLPTYG